MDPPLAYLTLNGLPLPDNFGVLRLLAAMLVVVSHSFVMVGAREPLLAPTVSLGAIGVYAFFAISGFLVHKSWNDDPHLGRFIVKRLLRILPALAVVVTLCVFVLGPLTTTHTLSDYFHDPGTYRYLQTALIFPVHFRLPGVFETNPYPGINGSLWTLPLEFTMYLLLAMCCLGARVTGRGAAAPLVTGLIACLIHANTTTRLTVATLNTTALAACGVPFFAGALLFQARRFLPHSPSALALPVAIALLLPLAHRATALQLGVAYVTIALAQARIGADPPASQRHGDVSYGIYIYAFPVQETIVFLAPGIGVLSLILASAVMSVGCGAVSWHFIERPALSLKPRPGGKPRRRASGPAGDESGPNLLLPAGKG